MALNQHQQAKVFPLYTDRHSGRSSQDNQVMPKVSGTFTIGDYFLDNSHISLKCYVDLITH